MENIDFFSDNIKLRGYIHLPSNSTDSFVIGSHGLLSDGNSGKQITLAKKLGEKNIGYLRFHHRGCGSSDGNIKETNLETRKKDLLSAFYFLKENFNFTKIGLFGSSMGGATVLYSHEDINPDAIATVAAPVTGNTMKESFTGSMEKLMEETGLPYDFFISNIDFDLIPKLNSVKNILILHGGRDEIVPFENSKIIYEKALEEKKLIELQNATHRVEDEVNQKIFMEETIKWFTKYLT